MPQITNRIIEKKTGICKFCGEEATLLCDMPSEVQAISMKSIYTNTCDNEICESCTTKFRGHDFCPECMRELRDVWNSRIAKTTNND